MSFFVAAKASTRCPPPTAGLAPWLRVAAHMPAFHPHQSKTHIAVRRRRPHQPARTAPDPGGGAEAGHAGAKVKAARRPVRQVEDEGQVADDGGAQQGDGQVGLRGDQGEADAVQAQQAQQAQECQVACGGGVLAGGGHEGEHDPVEGDGGQQVDCQHAARVVAGDGRAARDQVPRRLIHVRQAEADRDVRTKDGGDGVTYPGLGVRVRVEARAGGEGDDVRVDDARPQGGQEGEQEPVD